MEKTLAIAALAALAHDTRIDVYRLLVEAGPDGLAVGEIVEALDVPPATLTHHLAQLKQAGLVVCQRDGRKLIHSADFAQMNAMMGYLTENCCEAGACPPICTPEKE